MNKINLQYKYLPFSILVVAIFSVIISMQELTGWPVTNPIFWFFAQIIILILFYKSKRSFVDKNFEKVIFWIKMYLFWNIFSILRGLFIAETYWDWKYLTVNSLGLLVPIVAYVGSKPQILQFILRYFFVYGLPLFFLICFFINTDSYGFFLVPISFLALFFPILKTTTKWMILAMVIFVIFVDFTARSNVLKFGIPLILSLLYYFRVFLSITLYEFIRKLLFILPLLFLYLAIYLNFNVFKMDEYIKGDYVEMRTNEKGKKEEDNLIADSRSFMYKEGFLTAQYYDSWWIGRSPARGVISEQFGEDDMNKRGERVSNEMAIANIFNWTGIVGVILYFLVFYKATYLSINKSNNDFSKILGLYMAFRWTYAWVEDANYFSMTNFFIWFMLGLCYSPVFRNMDNRALKLWIECIFKNRSKITLKFTKYKIPSPNI